MLIFAANLLRYQAPEKCQCTDVRSTFGSDVMKAVMRPPRIRLPGSFVQQTNTTMLDDPEGSPEFQCDFQFGVHLINAHIILLIFLFPHGQGRSCTICSPNCKPTPRYGTHPRARNAPWNAEPSHRATPTVGRPAENPEPRLHLYNLLSICSGLASPRRNATPCVPDGVGGTY